MSDIVNNYNVLRLKMSVPDLNADPAKSSPFLYVTRGGLDVYRKNAVCAAHGFPSLENISSARGALRWGLSSPRAPLLRALSYLGLCPIDLSRELRDIEACLSAQSAKLYHMGIHSSVKRATLADANERRDWRIYGEFAQRLVTQARELYANEDLGLDLSNTVYALDSTTIDLCLALFPWAPFRSTKAAVKMHTLLDLRGAIPSFIHVSDGKLHDVNALDLLIPEPAAIYLMDRAYLDFERLFSLHQAGAFFVTRAKSNSDLRRVYSAPSDRAQGIICDQTVALSGFLEVDPGSWTHR